jgi:hypothetical protein
MGVSHSQVCTSRTHFICMRSNVYARKWMRTSIRMFQPVLLAVLFIIGGTAIATGDPREACPTGTLQTHSLCVQQQEYEEARLFVAPRGSSMASLEAQRAPRGRCWFLPQGRPKCSRGWR